jgi:hypothetical protein
VTNLVHRSRSALTKQRKNFVTPVDDLADEWIRVRIPIGRVNQRIAIERAKAHVPGEKLLALGTTPRSLTFLFVGAETSGVDFRSVSITGGMGVRLYAYRSRHLVESI